MKKANYYFGRLNIIASYEDKKQFILNGLKTKQILEKRGSFWGFFDIKDINSEIGTIIFGSLIKYSPEKKERVVELKNHELTQKSIENKVIGSSPFFIHLKSGLIAYHAQSKTITRKQFQESFCELFEKAYDKLFVDVEIQSIDEQFSIIETIRKFSKIFRIKIYLHPSNPSNREMWEKVDERLKNLRASSYHEQISAKPDSDGLSNIEDDEEIKSKIFMSEDGYGETVIEGIYDKGKRTISTKDNPIKAMAPVGDEKPENIFSDLLGTFRELLNRFKK